MGMSPKRLKEIKRSVDTAGTTFRRRTFVVTGYDPVSFYGVRSLSIAELEGKKLVPAGSVGSRLTAATSRDLRRQLDAGEPISVEIEDRGRTPCGGLRHATLAGIPEH